ncbi:hypothetical protein FNV43_RR14393 [Rhamnella rubrinervis]|uniref:AN1-type domain-containing protein n=1 Tax=Rhamnella rubrinervis TaxID=2594499 RepID=A0A8K0H2W6_9ROSA|nr:hypothetical protein FNV43_RR14393 [Rhamnella rubrinervis]
MGGGTEAFHDLGAHCQHSDCHQLDFLPFHCDACRKVFCLEHRSYKSHECPKSDHNSRKVLVCEVCSTSIETTGHGDEKVLLEKHRNSGVCDPANKKKPTCPVRRCKQVLTFSNTSTCKTCQLKVCLKHRFPVDHACSQGSSLATSSSVVGGRWNDKFLVALASRKDKDCAKSGRGSVSPPSTPSVKAC